MLFSAEMCVCCCCCRQPNRERLEFANAMLDEILDSADKPFDVRKNVLLKRSSNHYDLYVIDGNV